MQKEPVSAVVNFLFEAGLLNDIPRSGFHFLGGIQQSVAEHSYRITLTALALARLEAEAGFPASGGKPLDEGRLLRMCLLHDIPEARIGDQNYVNRKYVKPNEQQAIDDLAATLPFGKEYQELLAEFHAIATPEAQLARDADQIELLLMLRRAKDIGHPGTDDWIRSACSRLRTETGKQVGQRITETASDDWWFDRSSDWWVHGGSKK